MPPSFLTSDRDLAFLDAAEPITLRTVTTIYDPESLAASESFIDTPLNALVAPVVHQPTPGTANHHATAEIAVTFKREELPDNATAPTTRILYENRQFEVTRAEETPTLVTLHGRRIR